MFGSFGSFAVKEQCFVSSSYMAVRQSRSCAGDRAMFRRAAQSGTGLIFSYNRQQRPSRKVNGTHCASYGSRGLHPSLYRPIHRKKWNVKTDPTALQAHPPTWFHTAFRCGRCCLLLANTTPSSLTFQTIPDFSTFPVECSYMNLEYMWRREQEKLLSTSDQIP